MMTMMTLGTPTVKSRMMNSEQTDHARHNKTYPAKDSKYQMNAYPSSPSSAPFTMHTGSIT